MRVQNTPRFFVLFPRLLRMLRMSILTFKNVHVPNPFYAVLEKFSRKFPIIGGVEHALIFEVLFRGCQHGVGERVSVRGAVLIGFSDPTNWANHSKEKAGKGRLYLSQLSTDLIWDTLGITSWNDEEGGLPHAYLKRSIASGIWLLFIALKTYEPSSLNWPGQAGGWGKIGNRNWYCL